MAENESGAEWLREHLDAAERGDADWLDALADGLDFTDEERLG